MQYNSFINGTQVSHEYDQIVLWTDTVQKRATVCIIDRNRLLFGTREVDFIVCGKANG